MTNTPQSALPDVSLDQLFRRARTHNAFDPRPISEDLLRQVYDLARWPPTASNANPGRFLFLTSQDSHARLAPHLSSGNRAKTLAAPVTVIMAYDLAFAEHIPELFPHNPGAKAWFERPDIAQETAFRSGTLQAAYFMLAARALGLSCGPMSGFNADGVNGEFFAGTSWRANFLCNIGYGASGDLHPRLSRLPFDTACQLL